MYRKISDIKGPREIGDCRARWTWEMCGMQNQHDVGELARGDSGTPVFLSRAASGNGEMREGRGPIRGDEQKGRSYGRGRR